MSLHLKTSRETLKYCNNALTAEGLSERLFSVPAMVPTERTTDMPPSDMNPVNQLDAHR